MRQQGGGGQTPEPLPWKTSGKTTPAPVVQGKFGRVGRIRASNIRNNQPHIAVVDAVTVSFLKFPSCSFHEPNTSAHRDVLSSQRAQGALNTKDAGVMGE